MSFAKRLWAKLHADDVGFLAGGVAFKILLAGVPFLLLLAAAFGYALGATESAANGAVATFFKDLFPENWAGAGNVLDPVLKDAVRTRGAVGAVGGLAFLWFSAGLFGAARRVLQRVFDVPKGHHPVVGTLFDLGLTLSSAVLAVAYIALSAYFALARTRGVQLLSTFGLHSPLVMRPLTYLVGRVVTFTLLGLIFLVLYKILPNRKVRWQQAAFAALVSALLLELARFIFSWAVHLLNPASIYSGALAAIVVVVFWVYYAALIFIVGGEASQILERMRTE